MSMDELVELMRYNGVMKAFELATIEATKNLETVIYVQSKLGFFKITASDNYKQNEKFDVITFVPIRYIFHVLFRTWRLNLEEYFDNIIKKYW